MMQIIVLTILIIILLTLTSPRLLPKEEQVQVKMSKRGNNDGIFNIK
jgi:uncharacterized protein YpmS